MDSPTLTSDTSLPTLPTPDAFLFPYASPYPIQVQLMQTVFRAVEDRKIAIVSSPPSMFGSVDIIVNQVESPTGTGKSLTLLTATLTWLASHRHRLDEHAELALREQLSTNDSEGKLISRMADSPG